MEANKYVESGQHLPEILKDFHDQKDLFKAIYQHWGESSEIMKSVSWVNAQVFTIDIFLHWMGLHGYKLQKSRAKNVQFYDTSETISHFNAQRSKSFSKIILTQPTPSPTTPNPQNAGGNEGEGVGEQQNND